MMKTLTVACVALVAFTGLSVAQVKVVVIVGTAGPGAGLGIPFKNTFAVLPGRWAGSRSNTSSATMRPTDQRREVCA